MNKNILKWLKNKKNYVYYDVANDKFNDYLQRYSDCLIASRIHFSDLEDISCYIINDSGNKINVESLIKTHHNSKFRNFNLKIQEYLYDYISCIDTAKNITNDDNVRNRDIIYKLWEDLREQNYIKNISLSINKMSSIRDTLNGFINIDLPTYFEENYFPINDLKEKLNLSNSEYSGLHEIGVFFPFQFEHDIFENKYYLFEINQIRFSRTNYIFNKLIERYYTGYGINTDKSKKLTTLHDYFIDYSTQYMGNIAYFDPFKNYNKYKKEYEEIRKHISSKKLDFNFFINELFEFLNFIQFHSVMFQQANLMRHLRNYRSKDKQYSLKEFLENKIKEIKNNEYHISDDEIKYILEIHYFLQYIEKFLTVNKNTNLKELEVVKLMDMQDSFLTNAQNCLNSYLRELNKLDSSKLSYLNKYFNGKIKTFEEKYKLKTEHKKIIKKMILDLIFFYSYNNKFEVNEIEIDKIKSANKLESSEAMKLIKENEKEISKMLSKPFNQTMKNLFEKYKKKDINTIIDYNFKEEFIEKYQKDFDCYRKNNLDSEPNNFIKNHIVRLDIV